MLNIINIYMNVMNSLTMDIANKPVIMNNIPKSGKIVEARRNKSHSSTLV